MLWSASDVIVILALGLRSELVEPWDFGTCLPAAVPRLPRLPVALEWIAFSHET
jgi:hypothetical protein